MVTACDASFRFCWRKTEFSAHFLLCYFSFLMRTIIPGPERKELPVQFGSTWTWNLMTRVRHSRFEYFAGRRSWSEGATVPVRRKICHESATEKHNTRFDQTCTLQVLRELFTASTPPLEQWPADSSSVCSFCYLLVQHSTSLTLPRRITC